MPPNNNVKQLQNTAKIQQNTTIIGKAENNAKNMKWS